MLTPWTLLLRILWCNIYIHIPLGSIRYWVFLHHFTFCTWLWKSPPFKNIILHAYDRINVQLTHPNLGDRKDVFVAHPVTILKSPAVAHPITSINLSHCCRIFRDCVYEVDVHHRILSVVSYISHESQVFVSITTVQSMVCANHYDDVIMGAMGSQITSPAIVYSAVYSDADQGKHQSSV